MNSRRLTAEMEFDLGHQVRDARLEELRALAGFREFGRMIYDLARRVEKQEPGTRGLVSRYMDQEDIRRRERARERVSAVLCSAAGLIDKVCREEERPLPAGRDMKRARQERIARRRNRAADLLAGVDLPDGLLVRARASLADSLDLPGETGGIADRLPALQAALQNARDKQRAARERLVMANLPLVVFLLNSRVPVDQHFEDLVQEGNLGLMRAAERYDPRRGYRFSTYAAWWILQRVGMAAAKQHRGICLPVYRDLEVRKQERLARRFYQVRGRRPGRDELAGEMGTEPSRLRRPAATEKHPLSLDAPVKEDSNKCLVDFLPAGEQSDPESTLMRKSLVEQVRRALGRLSVMEEKVLRLRFGIGEDGEYNLAEIGRAFGFSRERARRIESQALRKLRRPVRRRLLAPFLSTDRTS